VSAAEPRTRWASSAVSAHRASSANREPFAGSGRQVPLLRARSHCFAFITRPEHSARPRAGMRLEFHGNACLPLSRSAGRG